MAKSRTIKSKRRNDFLITLHKVKFNHDNIYSLKISKMKQEKDLEQEQSLNNKFESKPMPSFIARVVKWMNDYITSSQWISMGHTRLLYIDSFINTFQWTKMYIYRLLRAMFYISRVISLEREEDISCMVLAGLVSHRLIQMEAL